MWPGARVCQSPAEIRCHITSQSQCLNTTRMLLLPHTGSWSRKPSQGRAVGRHVAYHHGNGKLTRLLAHGLQVTVQEQCAWLFHTLPWPKRVRQPSGGETQGRWGPACAGTCFVTPATAAASLQYGGLKPWGPITLHRHLCTYLNVSNACHFPCHCHSISVILAQLCLPRTTHVSPASHSYPSSAASGLPPKRQQSPLLQANPPNVGL